MNDTIRQLLLRQNRVYEVIAEFFGEKKLEEEEE